MWFTAVKRYFAIAVLFAMAAVGPRAATAKGAEGGVPVVAQLYKDFGWQAIVGTQDIFGPTLARQNKAVLDRYFDPTLTSLLVRDAQCAARSHEICRLDFDPLFASQDSRATELAIGLLGPGEVAVEFKYPSHQEKVRLEFRLTLIDGQWKIKDIIYRNLKGASLRKILENKLP